ncbi:MAG: TIM barrel protein [Candidatus Aenigmatarchaeota archaeon]
MPKFGVARKYTKNILDYIITLSQNNIEAYEMGFAYSIPSVFPNEIITSSKKSGVSLSCHLPFWINLGNFKNEKNVNYLVSGLKTAEMLGSVAVFHLGFYGKKKFNDLKENIINVIQEVLKKSNVEKGKLGIEITGKQRAIGTVDEIIELINLINDDRIIPVIDWSHLYGRNNGTYPYTYDDFKEVLEKFEKKIGYRPYYFHGGGIEYKNGNEVKHTSPKINEPPLPHLFEVLQDLGYKDFIFIVESPSSIEDVKWIKEVWKSPKNFEVPHKRPKTLFDFGGK